MLREPGRGASQVSPFQSPGEQPFSQRAASQACVLAAVLRLVGVSLSKAWSVL